MNYIKERIENGLDPLTGEKMETKGLITWRIVNGKGIICDETLKEVKLSPKGTWIYK